MAGCWPKNLAFCGVILRAIFTVEPIKKGANLPVSQLVSNSQIVIIVLQDEQDDEIVWDELFEMAKEMAVESKSTASSQCSCQHTQTVTAKSILLTSSRSLDTRAQLKGCWNRVFDSQGNISSPQSSTYSVQIQRAGSFATTPETWPEWVIFYGEVVRWKSKWQQLASQNHQLCKIPCASRLRSCIRIATAILTIIWTMPVSIATLERSFSCMRTVKTYLRSTMWAERLFGIALLLTYRDTSTDEHRHRQGGPGVLRQEIPQTGIWILKTCTQTFLQP